MTTPRPTAEEVANTPGNCLANKVILITGAGDGIGRAAAIDFAQAGAHVVLLGRTQQKLEAVYDQIEQTTDTKPIILPFDLSKLSFQAAQEISHAIEQHYGRLDGVLFNASILGSKMSIAQYPEKQWSDVMQVNVNSAFYLTRSLLPMLETAENGRVVYTTSSVGRKGRAFWGAYAVSKFATEGLMETLADELGPTTDIRTFAINPGGTRTSMRASAYPGEHPDSVPEPQAHMPLYRFLFSNAAQPYNGLSINAYDFLPASLS